MASGSERVGQKDECFSLKWNVHHTETFEAFESLRFKDALVDVSLCCEGHILKAHKLVLSACSPYFERILQDVGLRYPVLMFQDVPMYMMQLLLQFMYRYVQVNINTPPVVCISDHLKSYDTLRE
jgi:Cys2His2 zinc finger developmental/cell cycle regulator